MLHGFPRWGNLASVARKRIAVANLPLIRPRGATFPTGEGFKETGSLIFFPHRFTLSLNYCKMLYKRMVYYACTAQRTAKITTGGVFYGNSV